MNCYYLEENRLIGGVCQSQKAVGIKTIMT